MGNGNDSILEMYLYETNTLLEQLDSIVLAAEQAGMFSQDDVDEIFRIMHTLKGSAAMMEFNPLMTIAHRIEDLFYVIREKTMDAVPAPERPALFDLMFHSIDYFRAEVEKIENGEPLSENIDSFLSEINTFLNKIKSGKSEIAAPVQTAAPTGAVNAYPYGLRIFLDPGCGMESLRAFMIVGDIQHTCSDFKFYPEDVEHNANTSSEISQNGFLLTFRTEEELKKAAPLLDSMGFIQRYETEQPNMHPAHPEETTAPPTPEPEQPKPEPIIETKSQPATPKAGGTPQPPAQQHAAKSSLISVSLSKLDQLMAVVGEIVITESMVTASPDLKGLKLDSFLKSARQLRKLTDELQDISMSLRMVPVSGTFQKMHRVVRDMGQKLGKKVRLTIVGEDTEVDKTIVDAISDPIMHIVRNAMDHGIESDVEDRIRAGKDPEGEIILSAQHTGSEVIITIEDDGGGVDYDVVLNKAKRRGLIPDDDTKYSPREIVNFLMMPGFSTNTEVTEFSGRGVGMDVVKKNVEEVGGTVSITSEPGHGMCVTLKIPLTMAIMDGMDIAVGNSIFTIPIHNIRQSFKVKADEIIHDSMRGEMVERIGQFYSVYRLSEFFGLESKVDSIEDGIVMHLETSENSYCLFVDELIGEQQVVVKPLPSYLNSFGIKNSGIAGCTILGDGNISLILDAVNLSSALQQQGQF